MARPRLIGRAGPIGLALTVLDVWRRIPPEHRKRLLQGAREHGPRLAAKAVEQGRRRRGRS